MAGVEVVEDPGLAADIVSRVMGRYHGYYARAALERLKGAVGLVARLGGEEAGAVVCYRAEARVELGVIYYVVVLPRARGRGLGKLLVSSCEEKLGTPHFYVATIELRNTASARMFQSLGYRVMADYELADIVGWEAVAAIHHATCSYEEDLIALKEGREWVTLETLSKAVPDDYKDVWWEICYKPWMERKYRLA
ncbi:GNAT family N-acetyltransferase [Aeropyrum camini]|uniref:Sortase-related acyltransferase n=1 Tax=Aeropyrum camini SY1 = JCM 12091 TaxID=1198449 RepID=U3THB0_9CREN|nr:GNAT family N-acetyltransferase [Aeropyrum camini]BAN90714.1 sortase-related acyltransferase [Aeropyrum camini SY1 = JCM 12091]